MPDEELGRPVLGAHQLLRCSDPDDQKFIDLAVAHRCTLVSKDREVLRKRTLEDIPEDVQKVLTFHPVSTLDEVFAVALLPGPEHSDEESGQTMMERSEKRVAAAGA